MRFLAAVAVCACIVTAAACPAWARPGDPPQYAGEHCASFGFAAHAQQPRIEAGTAHEDVIVVATFADGHREIADFPYPFVYANAELSDPWSATNLRNPLFQFLVQQPPAGFDRATLPPLIAFLLARTDRRGFTNIDECGAKTHVATSDPDFNRRLWLPFDRSIAAAQVRISDLAFDHGSIPYDPKWPGGPYTRECFSFTNLAPHAATHVGFVFTYFGADGRALGTDRLDRRGSFAPNVKIDGTKSPRACVSPHAGWIQGAAFLWDMGNRQIVIVTGIQLSVDAVEYDDDSVWRPGVMRAAGAP